MGHTKAEVFEMVRDLDLPLEQGNIYLLKKLQALGLHANRFRELHVLYYIHALVEHRVLPISITFMLIHVMYL